MPEAHLEPTLTSNMELFAKIVNDTQLLTIFAKVFHPRCSNEFTLPGTFRRSNIHV